MQGVLSWNRLRDTTPLLRTAIFRSLEKVFALHVPVNLKAVDCPCVVLAIISLIGT